MNVAYLDCFSGISGDMMLGALIDAGASLENIRNKLASFDLPGLEISATPTTRKGFRALQIDISHPPQHAHRHLSDIEAMIESSQLNDKEKETSLKVFRNLAMAEAKVHGSTIEKVHFHEVGAIDSIADIVGVCIAICELEIETFCCSAVPTGSGTIKIAHGTVSLPAPATAELLTGCPIAQSDVLAELTTPTGAAFVRTFVTEFGSLPSMTINSIGIGCGLRDLESQANILRVILGTSSESITTNSDQVVELETNLDNTSGEQIGHCVERLLDSGALDVFLSPIQMKKNRPGTKLSVLCRPADSAVMSKIVFAETRTLGIRQTVKQRSILQRESGSVETSFGPIEGVVSVDADASEKFSPEYESCRLAAKEHGVSVRKVMDESIAKFIESLSNDREV